MYLKIYRKDIGLGMKRFLRVLFYKYVCTYTYIATKNKNLTLTSKRVDYDDSRSYTQQCPHKLHLPRRTKCGLSYLALIKLFLLLLQT